MTALTARDIAVSEPFLVAMLRGEVDIEEASAAAAFAVGWRRAAGGTGWQLIELMCLPWDVAEGIVAGLAQARLPLTGLAWRARPLFFALTMLQAAQAGRSWVAVAVATLGVLTYTHPWARRRWALQRQQAGDAEVIAQGLGIGPDGAPAISPRRHRTAGPATRRTGHLILRGTVALPADRSLGSLQRRSKITGQPGGLVEKAHHGGDGGTGGPGWGRPR